ncbi:MAG: hypothetical protein J0I41_22685 [Filimonas sp.]|nr:hypothetical protein [Filimonas sp.]
MNLINKYIFSICCVVATAITHPVKAQDSTDNIRKYMQIIRTALDKSIFANRFESIETSCYILDSTDDRKATRVSFTDKYINANNRIRLYSGKPDTAGFKCLSENCSRYLRLNVVFIDAEQKCMRGTVENTYAYPAPSLMQYLGMTANATNPTDAFFQKMISNKGTFTLSPKDDRYQIEISFPGGPFEGDFTMYGYVDMVKAMDGDTTPVCQIFFDRMAIKKGDDNNRIMLKFTSTSPRLEKMYFTRMIYDVLSRENRGSIEDRMNAVWLRNYLVRTPLCSPLLQQANFFLRSSNYSTPNINPTPAK